MHEIFSPRSSPVGWTTASEIASSPRREAIRWGCWSCQRGGTAVALGGGFAAGKGVPLSDRIEESFRNRFEALPLDTRRLLSLAAAEPLGDPALLRRASARLGISADAAEPARAEGLVEVDARVRFRHPLVRSAVYRDRIAGGAAASARCTR